MEPTLDRVDHIHIYVPDRAASELWYREVLGLKRSEKFEEWAVPHGPLMLSNQSGTVMLALFERAPEPNRTVVALAVSGEVFMEWITYLSKVFASPQNPVDHGLAWSVYFQDPDGNPFEITTYDYGVVNSRKAEWQ